MKNLNVVKILCLIMFVILLAIPFKMYAEPSTATVTNLTGEAEYKQKGAEKWLPIQNGQQLQEGAKVRTKLAAKLSLIFSDKSEVILRENSIMDIKTLKDSTDGDRQKQFKMWVGNVRAKVTPLPTAGSTFEVATPTSVAGVRGTDFTMDVAKDGTSNLFVREGSVAFKNLNSEKEVLVGQDQQSTSNPDGDLTEPEKGEDPDGNIKEENADNNDASSKSDTGTAADEAAADDETDKGAETAKQYVLMVSEPVAGSIFAVKSVKFSGMYGPDLKVSIGQQLVTCGPDGSFSEMITLAEGDNKVSVSSEDRGQSSEVPVVVDTIKPEIQLTGVLPEITNQSTLNLSLNTEANSQVKVGSVLLQTTSGVINTQVMLVQGVNNIQIVVTDKAGNVSEKPLMVELDSIAPSLIISQVLVDNASGNLIVSGIVEAGAVVTANGIPLNVNADGSFNSRIDWATSTDVQFEAKDKAGNITKEAKSPSGAVDVAGPTLQSISFSPASATVGDVTAVTVLVVASDASSLANSTTITLSGPTGRTLSGTLGLSGTNTFTGILSIPIDLPGGIYSVSSLTLTDALGNSSNVSSATTLAVANNAPSAPSSVVAVDQATGGKIRLTWTFASPGQDVVGLRLYQSMSSGGPYVLIANLSKDQTLYEISNLLNGTNYYFMVRSYDYNGNESLNSNEASAAPSDQDAPATPTLSFSGATQNSVNLSWSSSAGATTYKIYRSLTAAGGAPYSLVGQTSSTTYTVSGLASGSTYYFSVTALDDNIAPPTGTPNESPVGTNSVAAPTSP